NNPLSYLREIQRAFQLRFFRVACSTVFNALFKLKITRRVLERRALEIQEKEIIRFTLEIDSFHFMQYQLLFLDEMSTDNRSMIRRYGRFKKGERPVYHGKFVRTPRISILSFLGVNGLVDTYLTEGT